MDKHPGKLLRERISAYNLSCRKAADYLGVSHTVVNDLVKEKTDLSLEMAVRIQKVFKMNAEKLLTIQAKHSVKHIDFEKFPTKALPPAYKVRW